MGKESKKNGKYFNTMKIWSDILKKILRLNTLLSRKLKHGNWLIISPLNELLVVEESVYNELVKGWILKGYFVKEFEDALHLLGFIQSEKSQSKELMLEPKNILFKLLRIGLLIIGILSFFLLVILSQKMAFILMK